MVAITLGTIHGIHHIHGVGMTHGITVAGAGVGADLGMAGVGVDLGTAEDGMQAGMAAEAGTVAAGMADIITIAQITLIQEDHVTDMAPVDVIQHLVDVMVVHQGDILHPIIVAEAHL